MVVMIDAYNCVHLYVRTPRAIPNSLTSNTALTLLHSCVFYRLHYYSHTYVHLLAVQVLHSDWALRTGVLLVASQDSELSLPICGMPCISSVPAADHLLNLC